MIIKFRGATSVAKLNKHIKTVTEDIMDRAKIDASSMKVKDVEIGIVFMVDGTPMALDVVHDGISEAFTVMVQLDEKGNIEVMKDNEEQTFLDEYSRAVAKGEEPKYSQIHTTYSWDDLEHINTEHIDDDLMIKHYKQYSTGDAVHMYYKNGILVAEYSNEIR